MHTVPLSTLLYEIVSVSRKAPSPWVVGDRPVVSGRPVLVRRKGNELQVLRSQIDHDGRATQTASTASMYYVLLLLVVE